jgi:hypothetical protein
MTCTVSSIAELPEWDALVVADGAMWTLTWSQLCLCHRARQTGRTDLREEGPKDEPRRLALVPKLWLHEHISTVTFILS